MIRFSEAEATVEGVTAKVREALESEEGITLTDSQGSEILDSEGTRSKLLILRHDRSSQSLWYISHIRIENLHSVCSVPHLFILYQQFLILLSF